MTALLTAVSNAFGVARLDNTGKVQDDWSEVRDGLPVLSKSGELEDAVRQHYRPEMLLGTLPDDQPVRSVLVYPVLQDGAAAVIGETLARNMAVEISLTAASEMRAVKCVSVWPDLTFMTEFEIECLRVAGEIGGFTFEIFDRPEEPNAEDFRNFYEDPRPDVLWVIGHGQFEAHEPSKTGLNLGPVDILAASTLAMFLIPKTDRRLLVLNVCSGAEAQVTGGIARIGVAQELVGPHQAVIAHRWTAEPLWPSAPCWRPASLPRTPSPPSTRLSRPCVTPKVCPSGSDPSSVT
jgi:hypothetical protein